ncbi:MAG: hypothetical protein ACFCD0_01080 [Gemmataceae bacterium]
MPFIRHMPMVSVAFLQGDSNHANNNKGNNNSKLGIGQIERIKNGLIVGNKN